MTKRKIYLKNCFEELVEIEVETKNLHSIEFHELSGDDVVTFVYKDGNHQTYDSDRHFRTLCFEDGLPAKYYVTKKQINDFFKEFSYENRWNFLIKYANRIPQFSNKPKLIKIGEINE